jgi:hypothetical protein
MVVERKSQIMVAKAPWKGAVGNVILNGFLRKDNGGMNWIEVAQNGDGWQAVLIMMVKC